LIGLVVALAGGCAPPRENIPTYAWTNDTAALQTMQWRAQSIRTLSGTCLLTLTRPNGESVRLDGAIAMAPPDGSVRLRAWKFNQAVFDLTLTRNGLWIEMPRDQSRRERVLPASLSAAQLARAMALFGGDALQGSDLRVVDHGGRLFETRKPLPDGQTMVAQINRDTLTVRRYELLAPSGKVQFAMTLDRYVQKQGVVWPMWLSARSESGRIDVEMHDIDFNTPLPPKAFVPPRGAEKMP